MSEWIHVCGAIDICASRDRRDDNIKSILVSNLGIPITLDDSDENYRSTKIPKGSEGSLMYNIWQNPDIAD